MTPGIMQVPAETPSGPTSETHRLQHARPARGPLPARSLPPSTLPTILERRTTLMRTSSLEELRYVRDRAVSEHSTGYDDALPSAAALLSGSGVPQSLPASPSCRAAPGAAPFASLSVSPFDFERNVPAHGSSQSDTAHAAGTAAGDAVAQPQPSQPSLCAAPSEEPFTAWRSLCSWRGADQQWSLDDMCLRNTPGALAPGTSGAGGAANACQCSMDDLHVPARPTSVVSLTDGAFGNALRAQGSAPLAAAPPRERQGALSEPPEAVAAAARASADLRAPGSPTSAWHSMRSAMPPLASLDQSDLIDFRSLPFSSLHSPEPAMRSLDDLDLITKPHDAAAALWLPERPSSPERGASGAHCGDKCAAAAQRADAPPAAGAFASPPPPLRLSSVAAATPAGAPASCLGSDADDGDNDERAHTARTSPPRSPSSSQPWQRHRSVGHSGAGSAHTDGLRALRSAQHPGAMFHSGRSIAAEWLQVPAVPLLPGTQCHDDAMVPEATGWTRRHGGGRCAAAGGRSRSVASRNISHTSLMLPGDVAKLGVASSLASETSDWYASQREGGASASGWGVRAKGSGAAAWGAGDCDASAAPLGPGVPEGRPLDWGLDGADAHC